MILVLSMLLENLGLGRVWISDCLSFPELGDRYFRVAVRLEHENQQLLKALVKNV